MKLRNILTIGTELLLRNRLRASLSILGIFIGTASVLCMMMLSEGGKKLIADDIDKLGGANQFKFTTRAWITKNGRIIRWTRERFNMKDALAIEAECPDVLCVLPESEAQATFKTYQGDVTESSLKGVTNVYADWMRWEVQEGRFLSETDLSHTAQVCVLGNDIKARLFPDTSALGREVKIRYYEDTAFIRHRVVGVMVPRGRNIQSGHSLDDSICIPLTTVQKRIFGYKHIPKMSVFFKQDADVDEVIESALAVIRKRHRNTDEFVNHWAVKWTLERLEHFERVMKIGLVGIAGFSLFVGGIGIMNICLVSVGEKTREIGLRKSVGAKRIDIFWQFLMESMCLCFCGGVLGIMGGWSAAHGMAHLAVRIMPIVPEWPVVLSFPWMLTSALFSVFMGVSFGVYPAMRAARLSPIDALRTEN
ncbi:hypothetical protein C6503_23490 [Candidatus Poribacteria bacterium]|nr:MAG: hypothetical protein C6503_23490 [Candidatus Poribacteria bacterium]